VLSVGKSAIGSLFKPLQVAFRKVRSKAVACRGDLAIDEACSSALRGSAFDTFASRWNMLNGARRPANVLASAILACDVGMLGELIGGADAAKITFAPDELPLGLPRRPRKPARLQVNTMQTTEPWQAVFCGGLSARAGSAMKPSRILPRSSILPPGPDLSLRH
jgi:hypothetical protein